MGVELVGGDLCGGRLDGLLGFRNGKRQPQWVSFLVSRVAGGLRGLRGWASKLWVGNEKYLTFGA